jgi:hypothetical protein
VYKQHQKNVDMQSGDMLAEDVDFYTNLKVPWVAHSSSLGDYKFWMNIESCDVSGHKVNREKFYKFESAVENIGR